MNDTSLHYLTYDPDEIWNEMITNYVLCGGDVLYPGDEKEMLLRSVQMNIVQIFAGVDNALRMQTLTYAVGGYLDEIGILRNCERIQASPAHAKVNITALSPVTLSSGTTMTADGDLYFALDEDVVFTGYEQTLEAAITAVVPGMSGNGLLRGTELQLVNAVNEITSIIVSQDASGGNDKEDDETYRERIRTYGLTAITTGPSDQYEAIAKSVSSVIVDAKATTLGPGEVGVCLVLSDDTGKAALIQSVLDALSDKNVRPLTDHVTVYTATEIPYVLNVRYIYDTTTSIATAVAEAVEEYKSWQESKIGRPFNPDRLKAALYQAGATRVIWEEGSSFNGSDIIEYAEIGQTEVCKGTITIC